MHKKAKSTILNAVQKAGLIQKKHFEKALKFEQKESISSIVTQVDQECNQIIVNIIEAKFPTHSILSEEEGLKDKQSDYTWVIDPLDGTSNYVAGLPWFGILITLFKNDSPIIGSAYLPLNNQFFYAEKEHGATLNGKKLSIKPSSLNESLVSFSTDATTNLQYLKNGLNLYHQLIQNSRNVRSTNSLLDMLWIAENKLGACVNLFSKIWDISAPYLIIREAGGEFLDIKGNQLSFEINNESAQKSYGIIAGNKQAIAPIISHLK